jgi:Zn-dependent protease with chaperone function
MTALDAVLAQPGVQTLGWTLLHFIWQGALAACALAGVNAFIPRRSANARYVAACATLVLMLGVTVATFSAYRSGNGQTLAGWASATQSLTTRPATEALASRTPSAGGSEAIESVVAPLEMIAPAPEAAAPVAPPAPAPDLWISTHFGFLVPWLAGIWFVGVLALSLRLLGGWIVAQPTLERLRARLKVSLPVRLYQSARVEVPTVIGCLKPVILLPASAITGLSAMQLEALLAHELAHIRRHDYLVNLLQTVIETLLFYHPAVWWVSHRIRAEREHCCDDVAVEVCGNALVYARALAELEQARVTAPQLAVAANGGCLLERILRLVKGTPAETARTSQWIVGAIAMATVLLVIAGARLTPPSDASMLNDAQIAIAEPDAPMTAEQDDAACDPEACEKACDQTCDQNCEPACDATKMEEAQQAMEAHQAAMVTQDAAMEAHHEALAALAATQDLIACNDKDKNPRPNPNPQSEPNPNPDPSLDPNPDPDPGLDVIDLGNLEDLGNLDDATIRRAVAKALAERDKKAAGKKRRAESYSRLLLASGLLSTAPIQPVAPAESRIVIKPVERIQNRSVIRSQLRQIERQAQRYARSQAINDPAQEELVQSYVEKLNERGIPEDYIRGMAGLQQQVTMADLIKLSEHGVSVEYLGRLEELGYDDLTAEQVVRLAENGVTPEYAAGMKFLGRDKFSVEDLIKLREHGITADYIGQLNVLGFRDQPIDRLIKLREHGVGPGYIAELRALGYKLSIPDLIVLKEHGITARYVAELRGLGYSNLTVQQIIKLHEQGVTSGYISELDASGLRELTTDELVALRSNGVSGKLVMDARLAGLTVANLKVQKLIELSQKGLSLLNGQN